MAKAGNDAYSSAIIWPSWNRRCDVETQYRQTQHIET